MASTAVKVIRIGLGIGALGAAYALGRTSDESTQQEIVEIVASQARENPASCGQTALAILQKSLAECPADITNGLVRLYQSDTSAAQDFSRRLQGANIDAYNAVFGSMPTPPGLARAGDIEVRDAITPLGRYTSLVDRLTNMEYGVSRTTFMNRSMLSLKDIGVLSPPSSPAGASPETLAPAAGVSEGAGARYQQPASFPPATQTLPLPASPSPAASLPDTPALQAPTGIVGNSLQRVVQTYDGVRAFLRQR